MIRFELTVAGEKALDRAFNRVDQYISDFRNMWPAVTADFYSIEEELFNTEGGSGASGKWAPLSPAYKKYKAKKFPNQPILRATNNLFESLTGPDAPGSIYRADKFELTIGSKEPYAVAHQKGLRVPRRPAISLTERDKRRMQKTLQKELVQFTREQGFQVDEKAA